MPFPVVPVEEDNFKELKIDAVHEKSKTTSEGRNRKDKNDSPSFPVDSKTHEIQLVAPKRRRGSFFRIGGLKRKIVKVVVAKTGKQPFFHQNPKTIKVESVQDEKRTQLQESHSRATEETQRKSILKTTESLTSSHSCAICNMNFATQEKFNLHLKFSATHEKNITALAKKREIDNLTSNHSSSLGIEMKPKMLIEGDKFILRPAAHLEVYIYQEPPTSSRSYKRYPICCYNVDRHEEYPVFFLNGTLVDELIHLQKQAKLLTEKPHVTMEDEIVRDFILARIAYREVDFKGSVSMVKLLGDNYDSLVVPGPEFIEKEQRTDRKLSVAIVRGFKEKDKELQVFQHQLVKATQTAADLAGKTRKSLEAFTQMFGGNPRIKSIRNLESNDLKSKIASNAIMSGLESLRGMAALPLSLLRISTPDPPPSLKSFKHISTSNSPSTTDQILSLYAAPVGNEELDECFNPDNLLLDTIVEDRNRVEPTKSHHTKADRYSQISKL